MPAKPALKHDIHKYRDIVKLTDKNWLNWKFNIIGALQERGLWTITTGEEPCPEEVPDPKDISQVIPPDTDELTIWTDKDTSARAQIIQNLSPDTHLIPFLYVPIVRDILFKRHSLSFLYSETCLVSSFGINTRQTHFNKSSF